MLRRVDLVRTDVSEVRIASVVRVFCAACFGCWFVVPNSPNFVTLMMEAISSSETSVLTRATRRNTKKTTFFIVTAV
jgi:hypothetical protein